MKSFARRHGLVLVAIMASLGSAGVLSAKDAGPRWIETASWQGSGTVYTEPFYIAGGRWRVKFFPEGDGPFEIAVCDATARPVAKAAVADEVLPGWRTFQDTKGYRILRVMGPKAAWRITVEQHLSVGQQWVLSRRQKKHMQVYRRIGIWSGEGAPEAKRFTVPIAEAPWRLVLRGEERGRLDAVLRNDNSGEATVHITASDGADLESWGYAAGTYTLEVRAPDCAWTAVLYAAGLKQ